MRGVPGPGSQGPGPTFTPCLHAEINRLKLFRELTWSSWSCLKDETLNIAPTKHWTFSEKAHIWKFRNTWNEITEKYIFFFFFQPSVFFIFVKIWTPAFFSFYIRLIKLWRNNEHVLRIIRSCCVKGMIVFQELNFDQVKEILKTRCHIYILMKKVIILRRKWSLWLHHSNKLNIFTSQLLIYYMQYENRKSRQEQMLEAATWGGLRKKVFFKMSQN